MSVRPWEHLQIHREISIKGVKEILQSERFDRFSPDNVSQISRLRVLPNDFARHVSLCAQHFIAFTADMEGLGRQCSVSQRLSDSGSTVPEIQRANQVSCEPLSLFPGLSSYR